MGEGQMQIGEVAERTSLSLRTIRYYEEVGLVVPSARSHGGFRLYSETEVARLEVVRRMKPLDFSLDEMRQLLAAVDSLENPATTAAERHASIERLKSFGTAADERCQRLRRQLQIAEEFAESLAATIQRG